MDHSERFQASLDIKRSLTHSFNPETKPTALGKDYFFSTSVSALAPSSWWGKRWFYLEQKPGYIPPPPSPTSSPASSPSRITPVCFHGPRHRSAPLPLPHFAGTDSIWGQPGWFICLQWSVVAGVGKGVWWGSGGITPPLCAKGPPSAAAQISWGKQGSTILKYVGSFEIIVVLKLPQLN